MRVSKIVFACVLGGSLLGILMRASVPEGNLTAEAKDLIKLGMGLIATISALVLGLLIASAKGSFDTQHNGLAQTSANVIFLDRVLAHYGKEAKEARDLLRRSVVNLLEQFWPEDGSRPANVAPAPGSEALYERIQELSPETEAQRALQAQALKTGIDIARARWSLFAQRGSSIPTPFLVVLGFWLTILFTSFSLFAPPNPTVLVTLLVCALSVSAAIFVIMELDQPFGGWIQVSSAPLREALAQLGR